METLLNDESLDEHYHDASEHGLVWVLLNEMLHLIVLLFTLFGMIRFKVKFIHMHKLVRLVSTLMIIHSWYMTTKFAAIALVMYFFNQELESVQLTWPAFNCSLANADKVFSNQSRNLTTSGLAPPPQRPYALLLAHLLHNLGGPYKMLGNRATLMYGFYSVAILIMLAIFPIELIYLDVGFNYIRFVLNDNNCMRALYSKRQKHLDRLSNWSLNSNKSLLTLSMKKITNQRDLRISYLFDGASRKGPVEQLISDQFDHLRRRMTPHRAYHETTEAATSSTDQVVVRPEVEPRYHQIVEEKSRAPIKSLRHSLSINHMESPSYSVRIANKNLIKFRPLVRSESWFKLSMVIYPIFISYYFVTLALCIGAISNYFNSALEATNSTCANEVQPQVNLYADWSFMDQMTFFESRYVVFSLSLASSFYCSYYFGTILELHVWIQEISQQLNLCQLVLKLTCKNGLINSLPIVRDQPTTMYSFTKQRQLLPPASATAHRSAKNLTPENSPLIEAVTRYHDIETSRVDRCFNQFGGLNCLRGCVMFKLAPQSERLKQREYMACKLVFKKQTILRATYININLFFDELNDTRFMIKTILKRTTQIAFGFALLVGVTRSQFKSNYLYLTFLLGACLAILNLYLICAASINSTVSSERLRQ